MLLYRLVFGQSADLQAMSDQNALLMVANQTLKNDLRAKTQELHAFVDALLMENGRAPLYLRPDLGAAPQPQPPVNPMAQLGNVRSPRAWSQMASDLKMKAEMRAEQGILLPGE